MGTPSIHCLYLHEELLTILDLLTAKMADQETAFDSVVASVAKKQTQV